MERGQARAGGGGGAGGVRWVLVVWGVHVPHDIGALVRSAVVLAVVLDEAVHGRYDVLVSVDVAVRLHNDVRHAVLRRIQHGARQGGHKTGGKEETCEQEGTLAQRFWWGTEHVRLGRGRCSRRHRW